MVYKLKKNIEFRIVYRRGKSFANDILVLYVLKNNKNKDKDNSLYNKVGISVSKKVGNSVVRHHLTRLVREVYRLHEDTFNSGLDVVVIARVSAKDISYHQVESSLLHLANLHHIMHENG